MAQFSLKKTHVRLLVKDPTCFLFPNSTFSKIMPYTTGKLSISSGKLSNSLSYKKKKKKVEGFLFLWIHSEFLYFMTIGYLSVP